MLLNKLYVHGFTGIILNWFRVNLKFRKRYLLFGDQHCSSLYDLGIEVSQGSVLSHFFFFITDMYKTYRYLNLIHYVKETTAFLTGDHITFKLIRIDEDLQQIHSWLQVNRLIFNITESSIM